MEENKPFMEKRKGFLDGLYGGGECPGKADYVKDMISGGEKDDGTTLDGQGRALRGIKKMNDPEENMGENIRNWAKRIWNTKTPTLDKQESGSCEIDRDGE